MGYGDVPVKEKMFHGNSFRVVVRNLDEGVGSKIKKYCDLGLQYKVVKNSGILMRFYLLTNEQRNTN